MLVNIRTWRVFKNFETECHIQCSHFSGPAKNSIRGWPFGFGGGVWVISEKKNILRLISRGKILQGNTWGKDNLHWKKNLSWRIIMKKNRTPFWCRKKFYLKRYREKILTQTKSPTSPPLPQKSNGRPLNWMQLYAKLRHGIVAIRGVLTKLTSLLTNVKTAIVFLAGVCFGTLWNKNISPKENEI